MTDEAARHEVRTNLGDTLFVEAGAGTGKTTVLVDRIVNLVKAGAEMRRIAAITFTEAAATELRDRIRAELNRAELIEAVAEVDEAAISTLHAFAQRILAEHPLEAGLPPSVEVLAPPKRTTTVKFEVSIPRSEERVNRRFVLTADVWRDREHLGELTEGLINMKPMKIH